MIMRGSDISQGLRRLSGRGWLLSLFALLAACRGGAPAQPVPPTSQVVRGAVPSGVAANPAVHLYVSAQVQGTTAPCGCTTEPLGDTARIVGLLRGHPGQSLWLDAGDLLHAPGGTGIEKQAQARLQAAFLEQTLRSQQAVMMIQPADLSGQADQGSLGPRTVCNLTGLSGVTTQSEALREVAGLRIGLLGVADPSKTWPAGVQVSEPEPAVERARQRLREQRADLIVALTGLPRDGARRLARRVPGLDLVVAGADPQLPDGVDLPELVGQTLVLVPGNRGQRLFHVTAQAGQGAQSPWRWVLRAAQREVVAQRLEQRWKEATDRLASLRLDKQAEPAFVATTEREVASLQQERAHLPLAAASLAPGQIWAELVPIRQSLPRDPEVAQAMTRLDREVGQANLARAIPPPPPVAGIPAYVGVAACAGACHAHDEAVEFWRKTRHAEAFPTLVQAGKDLSYDCVECHVVGFEKPGGSSLLSIAAWQHPRAQAPPPAPDLRGVQCEVCHGPGAAHIKSPVKNPLRTPSPGEAVCLVCHTKEHSDTFSWVPYARDILGPGHGQAARAALGDGPTGHMLRSAGKHKAAAH